MKIVAAGNSKNLRKEDVPHPFIAIISEVRVQTFEKTAWSPREDKDMLHFADPNVKPLGLNVTNKRIIIAAYGDESDKQRLAPRRHPRRWRHRRQGRCRCCKPHETPQYSPRPQPRWRRPSKA